MKDLPKLVSERVLSEQKTLLETLNNQLDNRKRQIDFNEFYFRSEEGILNEIHLHFSERVKLQSWKPFDVTYFPISIDTSTTSLPANRKRGRPRYVPGRIV
jgi:hypothetical protein